MGSAVAFGIRRKTESDMSEMAEPVSMRQVHGTLFIWPATDRPAVRGTPVATATADVRGVSPLSRFPETGSGRLPGYDPVCYSFGTRRCGDDSRLAGDL